MRKKLITLLTLICLLTTVCITDYSYSDNENIYNIMPLENTDDNDNFPRK